MAKSLYMVAAVFFALAVKVQIKVGWLQSLKSVAIIFGLVRRINDLGAPFEVIDQAVKKLEDEGTK